MNLNFVSLIFYLLLSNIFFSFSSFRLSFLVLDCLSFALCLLCVSNRNSLDSVLDDESDEANEGRDTDNEADILRCCRAEGFETRQQRAFAASVLDRPEQLMMYAQSEHDVS